ncbi:MAG: CMP-5'-phosphonoformate--3-phosphoglycerate phosphonoformyl transferase [Isosphaeraceae bacterium]|nr:CMP-5'-phosphonoformate--3-phosphoglycerate phosphonoformyl transferase [Isosphaeraceae bacterium]
MKPKIYLLVLCGAGDRPIQVLGHRTPLEAAATEHLDALAERGVQGMLTVIDDKICPESDSGIMALLGYDPLRYYTGRGALEALGLGFMEPGDNAVGFRINFASYNADDGTLDRRTARDLSYDEQQQLVAEIREARPLRDFPGLSYAILGFGRHRGIVCFKSATFPLGANVTNTDPGFRKVGPFGVPNDKFEPKPQECLPLDDAEGSAMTAKVVNRFVRETAEVLARSDVNSQRRRRGARPANLLLFRDAGAQMPSLRSFSERYGRTLSLYGQVPAEHGLCKLVGGKWNESRLGPGEDEDDYYQRLVTAVRRDPSDVVVIHIKGADEPGHDGLPHEKVRAIERFDHVFLRRLLEVGEEDAVYVITGDHTTPCELGIHSADPVPTLVSARALAADGTRTFCEREAARGGLEVSRAADLLPHLERLLSASAASHPAGAFPGGTAR